MGTYFPKCYPVFTEKWSQDLVGRAALQVSGPTSLADTHYWGDEKVRVRWEWRKTAVKMKEKGLDQTACIARRKIKNLDAARVLNVTSVSLILEDRKGVELDSTKHSFGSWSGMDLKPGDSHEFTMKYWVPTGFLRDVRELSARLGFDFKAEEQKPKE